MLRNAWNEIGDYYFDRQQYQIAQEHYSQAHNSAGKAECCYRTEDWHGLETLVLTCSCP